MSKAAKMIRTGDDPILRAVCDPVAPAEPLPFLDLMARACRKNDGAGLAAPQVGIAKRVIFLNCRDARGTIRGRFMVNPAIVDRGPETVVAVEGCLSYPGRFKAIRRHAAVTVEYLDEARRFRTLRATGFEARVIQHEVDHLDGVCKVGDPAYPADVGRDGYGSMLAVAAIVAAVA